MFSIRSKCMIRSCIFRIPIHSECNTRKTAQAFWTGYSCNPVGEFWISSENNNGGYKDKNISNLVAFHKIILYTINASGDSAPRVWRLLSGNQAGLSSKICSALTFHRDRTCGSNLVSTNSSSFQSSVHHFDPKKDSWAHPNY